MAQNISSLLATYIRLRQQGWTMDETVNRLQDAAQQLPRDDRHQLGNLVMEWEEKYGKDPRQSPVPEPPVESDRVSFPHSMVIPQQAPPPPAPQQSQPKPAPNAFGTRYLDPSKLAAITQQRTTQTAAPIASCPHCGSPNPASNTMCRNCGQPLRVKPASPTRRLDDTITRKSTFLADYFTIDSALLLNIRGSVIEGYPRDKMIMGRGFSPVQGQPFLDLSPYDGEVLGVSRYHVELRLLNNTLIITDLDSDNGTYINGMRLYPYEIRVLHNNDELRLGHLVMRVNFRVPQR